MRASQLFAVCRERFRRARNPQAVNENLSFIIMPGLQTLPGHGELGQWMQNNATGTPAEFAVGPADTPQSRWTFQPLGDFPYWRRLKAATANQGGIDSMILEYDHGEPTGELYLRCVFRLGPQPPDAGSALTIFSIRDVATGGIEAVLEVEPRPTGHIFSVSYIDKNGQGQMIASEEIPRTSPGGTVSFIYDVRVGIYGVEKELPYIHVYRPEGKFSYVSYLQGEPGSGFIDTPGKKRMAWCSSEPDGLIPAGDIRPVRLGVGNLIKEALP